MKTVIENIVKLQSGIAGVLLATSLGLIAFQLLAGYMGAEAAWAGRASLCALIWGVFLESGVLVHEKSHFSVRILSGKLKSRRWDAAMGIGVSLVKLAFSVLLIYYGFQLGGSKSSGTGMEFLRRGCLWLSLPVCGLTSSLYLISHIREDWHCLGNDLPDGAGSENRGGEPV